jgi:RNA polymerase sigma factor, sigma-70 family
MQAVIKSAESDLLEGIRKDVPGKFEQLFNAHWEDLYRQAYHRLQDQLDAEDLVQDIFSDLWERRQTLNITTSIRTYLWAALKYKIIKRAARADLQKRSLEHLTQQMGAVESTILDLLSAGEIHRTLESAIQRFPENMRRVFTMRAEDFTVAEIADALGLSEQTVKNNTTDALHRLRAALAEKHPDIPPSVYLILALFIKT